MPVVLWDQLKRRCSLPPPHHRILGRVSRTKPKIGLSTQVRKAFRNRWRNAFYLCLIYFTVLLLSHGSYSAAGTSGRLFRRQLNRVKVHAKHNTSPSPAISTIPTSAPCRISPSTRAGGLSIYSQRAPAHQLRYVVQTQRRGRIFTRWRWAYEGPLAWR